MGHSAVSMCVQLQAVWQTHDLVYGLNDELPRLTMGLTVICTEPKQGYMVTYWHEDVVCAHQKHYIQHGVNWLHKSYKWSENKPLPTQDNVKKMQCAVMSQHYTHIHFTALCLGLSEWASTRKVKPIWSKRQWVAAASAGPNASLQLAPDR